MNIFTDLKRRERALGPIRIAVVGTGFFGAGLLKRITKIQGMVPTVAANRTLESAIRALRAAGVERAAIEVCDEVHTAQAALDRGQCVATSSLQLPAYLSGVDVVMETTGDVLVGAEVALEAIRHRKHVVAANPETQATVGPILKSIADQAGVIYSDVDGDQPGILKNLYDYCVGLGFAPLVAGNCKGVLKRYATPESQAPFALAHGLKPWIASAAADGTKLNIEMALVANATGMVPVEPGMVGPQTTLETLVEDLERFGLFAHGRIVEYTLGIPNGVFVVVQSDDPDIRGDFRYLKMGDGPYYVFYRPHVLVHYEAPLSAAEAVLYGTATITPSGCPVAEVASFAKQDLTAGQRLDGIGGFHCYGLITRWERAHHQGLLPIGLAAYGRLIRDIAKDEAIPYDAVLLEEKNLAIDLRQQQDQLFITQAVRPV
jgi:predicted homoserine dehydrogenase-like protein